MFYLNVSLGHFSCFSVDTFLCGLGMFGPQSSNLFCLLWAWCAPGYFYFWVLEST